MTTISHHPSRGSRRHALSLLLAAAAAAAASAVATLAVAPPREHLSIVRVEAADSATRLATARQPASRPYSYGWPVKPFDRQHPVRGGFGDPRTMFAGGPMSACFCSFHQGIDISAPDHAEVYPVESGVVRIVTRDWVQVNGSDGHAFQYWHIAAAVHVGQQVEARSTVLGTILFASEHVHLTELQDGHAVDPLAPGHIGPYSDTTTPRVTAITFRSSDRGPDLLPELLHGRIEMVAAAEDPQATPAPGMWKGLPTTPAKLTYRIELLMPKPARLIVPETVARDVTQRLPASPDMWQTYARGTRMNMPGFGPHRYWLQHGVYLFKLNPTPLDTTKLHAGVYRLTVTASDAAGNASSSSQLFTVHNGNGWLKG